MDEKIIINIGGMHCVNCAKTIETSLARIKGVRQATVAFAQEKAIAFVDSEQVRPTDLQRAVETAGFTFLGIDGSIKLNDLDAKKLVLLRSARRKWIIGFIAGGALMALGMTRVGIALRAMMLLQLVIATPVFLYVSYPIFKAAWSSLRNRALTMDVMYAMGMGVAYMTSLSATLHLFFPPDCMFFDTAVLLAAFLTFGRYLEQRARSRTSSSIRALMDLRPKVARVIRDNKIIVEPVETVKIGEMLQVLPGDAIPVDGEVVSGESYVDESMLSGEPIPKMKTAGSRVIAGAINKNSALTLVARGVGNDTVLAQIIKLVEDAQNLKPAIQRIADKAVSWFIPSVLFIAIAAFLLWYVAFGLSLVAALTIGISIIVVACPCALGLATPTALSVGLGRAAHFGVLIKNGETIELLEKISVIAFDKTGTLTTGMLAVTDVVSQTMDTNHLLSLAASVEQYSRHPLALSVVAHAHGQKAPIIPCSVFNTEEGKGITGIIDNREIIVGSEALLTQRGIILEPEIQQKAETLSQEAKSVLYVAYGNTIAGLIACADTLKESSRKAVTVLHAMGLTTVMMSGDNERTARAIGKSAGIDTVFAGILPAQKAQRIKELQASGKRVAFVGDGINDAVALAQADIGIAIGAGTDVAVESADMVLMRDDCLDVAVALQLGKAVMRRIRLNLFWAVAYNAALIPFAAGLMYPLFHVMVRPEWAGLAMAMSSVTVVTLSLGLRRFAPTV